MAHNGERNPLVKTAGLADIVNNVVYNPFGTFSHVDMENQLVDVLVNYVGNYFKPGPNTTPHKYGIRASYPGPFGAGIYVQDNIGPGRLNDDLPQIYIVNPDTREYVVMERYPSPLITTTSAAEAYLLVLNSVGNSAGLTCDGVFIPRRDRIDERIINDVRLGTGRIIDDPSEVGGYVIPETGLACKDSDHDGMPDEWEKNYGFNPNDMSDNSADADRDGYTNIDEFLNGTNPVNR
jgi:pectate lyase